jgi:Raf kinase inhibitor-like YbhB/YbcL family protein
MRMRMYAIVAALAFLLAASADVAFAQGGGGGGRGGGRGGAAAAGGGAPVFRLTSTAFIDSGGLNYKYTCSVGAEAVSPPLAWSNPPMGTVSYTLIVHDMDPRPMKGLDDILHWMVWNIPATTVMLPANVPNTSGTLPDGVMQRNGNAQGPNLGYRPPCPPAGPPHHYAFELFALDTHTDLPATASRDDVTKAMDGHILGHSVLIGLYNR